MTTWTVACQAPLSVGILQARILEWIAMPSSKGSSQPREQTQVSLQADSLPSEPPGKPSYPGYFHDKYIHPIWEQWMWSFVSGHLVGQSLCQPLWQALPQGVGKGRPEHTWIQYKDRPPCKAGRKSRLWSSPITLICGWGKKLPQVYLLKSM